MRALPRERRRKASRDAWTRTLENALGILAVPGRHRPEAAIPVGTPCGGALPCLLRTRDSAWEGGEWRLKRLLAKPGAQAQRQGGFGTPTNAKKKLHMREISGRGAPFSDLPLDARGIPAAPSPGFDAMTYRSILASLALSSALVSFPCDSSAAPRVVDRVAALVNEEMIPLSEIYSRAMPQLMQMQQMGKATAESRKEVLKMALEECIADRLLAAEQKAYGIEVTTDLTAKAEAAVEELKRGQDFVYVHVEAPDEMAHQGLTMEKYREKLKTDLASMRLVNFKVRSKIKVSDEDIRTEYEKMVRESKADFEVHARHIEQQDLLTVAKNVKQLRKGYVDWLKWSLPLLVVWAGWIAYEVVRNLDRSPWPMMIGLGIGMAFGMLIGLRYRSKAIKTCDELIKQIEE